jgi:site-specific recombinase XerC
MKREIVLQPEQVKAILLEAKNNNLRDYLLLRTMTVGDFRVGEVVGSAARRWVKSERRWDPAEPNLRGLQIQDLQDGGIWVEGKGWKKAKDPVPPKLVPLPKELIDELRVFTAHRKQGRIFEVSESRVEQITRLYAKKAGLVDWKLVHPHRFRHFTTTQIARKHGVLAARDIARHANISTTNRYIAELPDDEKRKIIQAQEDLISV